MSGEKVKRRGPKPQKPYPEFPLYAHAAGMWAKTIRGRTEYFGVWADPEGALDRYLRERDYLHAGRSVPTEADAVTLDELVNQFLAAKQHACRLGEISRRHYLDYERDGRRLLDALGRRRPAATLRPADFAALRGAISEGRNATTIANIVVRMRTIFRWAHTTKMLPMSVDYGGQFALPPARARRRALRAGGSRMFEPAEMRRLLDATGSHPNLHAMILLGVNAGLGNTDCAELRLDHLDLRRGMLDFPRPKTEMPRRATIWPETVKALRDVIDHRATARIPPGLGDRVFVTIRGEVYVRLGSRDGHIDSIGLQFGRLCRRTGLHRRGRGFYALRHTFRTVADETRDFPAIDLVMGHTPADSQGAPFAVQMADRYRERISDARLKAVSDYVHQWLFAPAK